MFEKEIKFIRDFCLNKTSKAGLSLTYEKLERIELHQAILKYISADIDYRVYVDRQILLNQSSFDYSGAEISKYFKLISDEIKKIKIISENEITDLISKAVTFNINFMVQPNQAIADFIFPETERQPLDELKMLLEYLYYYPYLKSILLTYAEKKHLTFIERKDFEQLLTKIDSELFKTSADKLLESAIDSMADFFNIGSTTQSSISLLAVELFLKEKKLESYLSKLQTIAPALKPNYEIDELKKIVFSKAAAEEIVKEIDEPKETSDELKANITDDEIKISKDLKREIDMKAKEDLVEKPVVDSGIIETDIPKADNPIVPETTDLSDEIGLEKNVETFLIDTNEIAEMSNQRVDDKSERNKRRDILSGLSDREIEKIISSIFNEDKNDFATTIETISECSTYEKATEILKVLYTTFKVNPYSREAILLTNAVAKYFTTV